MNIQAWAKMIHFKQKENVENEIPLLIFILKMRFTKKIVFFFVKMQRKIVTSFYALWIHECWNRIIPAWLSGHRIIKPCTRFFKITPRTTKTKWVTCKEPQEKNSFLLLGTTLKNLFLCVNNPIGYRPVQTVTS